MCSSRKYLSHPICCFSGGGKCLCPSCKSINKLGDNGVFRSGHMGEVNLPVFVWLISSEIVQGLVYLEGSL